MIVSCCAFASMWVMIRYASRDLHAFQIVFFRNAIGTLVLLPMILTNPGLIRLERLRPNLRRATSGFVATLGTFYAVSHAPMATALSINYTAPLFATVGAVLFLGERIRARRVAALIIGFLGMLIVVRPGALPACWSFPLPSTRYGRERRRSKRRACLWRPSTCRNSRNATSLLCWKTIGAASPCCAWMPPAAC